MKIEKKTNRKRKTTRESYFKKKRELGMSVLNT